MKQEHEVVISGMSGRFPNCSDEDELKHCLLNKINCVVDEGRWPANLMDVPHQIGRLKDPYFFDITYFGTPRKVVEHMEPNVKNSLECAVAAVHDAGIRLNDIAGSDTVTFSSFSFFETDYEVEIEKPQQQNVQSYAKCMQANRIAYFMNLKGPSFAIGSDWNGSLIALKRAKELISSGRHRAAIVAASNFIFGPQISYHFDKLGRLNHDGKTKCFSEDADGYSRSEGCVVFFLQRKEDALRSYGTLLGVEISPPGTKVGTCVQRSLPDPSFWKKCYETAKVDPASVSYLEASGCASKTLEAQELNTLSEVLLPNRKTPLLIGSIKSNIGHGEAASSFFGILKLLIAAETGVIPPNINYSSPNKLVPALLKKQLKVVTEVTPLSGDILAVNNFSAFGGVGHVIIRRNTKCKKRQCQVGVLPPDDIPRLVLLSSRVEEELHKIIDKVEKMPVDEEFIALTHRTFGRGIKNHLFRGYTILQGEGVSQKCQDVKAFSCGETRRPVWAIFAGMGAQWPGMGAKLMKFPIFANSIRYCHSILQPFGVDLIDIVTNPKPDMFDQIFNCFVGVAAVQIGLVDILKGIGLEVDGIIGHSVGEVVCSYLDGSLTAEQALLTAYYRAKVSEESNITGGLMAAVGMQHAKLEPMLPDGIDIACRNSSSSCTISGPVTLVEEFLDSLREKGIFVRAVKSGDIAYHSRYIQKLGPAFLEALRKVIPDPKERSAKWISSSVPEKDWDSDLARYSSAEYHANNLLSPVLFEEAIAHIPKDAVIIEVAPRDLLRAIITRALPSATYIPLTTIGDRGDITFLKALGSLYLEGITSNIENLYPEIEFPVSRGTPSLSPLITWAHKEIFNKWAFLTKKSKALSNRIITFNDPMSKYNRFANCSFKGTTFVPGAAYIELVIEIYKEARKTEAPKILLQNIVFPGIVKYGDENPVHGILQAESGKWEFTHRNKEVATGTIEEYFPKDSPYGEIKPPHVSSEILSVDEALLYLGAMGLTVNKESINIESISFNSAFTSACALISWQGDWLAFLDSVFTLLTLFHSYKNNKLFIVERISHLFINLNNFLFDINKNKVFEVFYNSNIGLLWTDGLELHLPLMTKLKTSETHENSFQVPRFVAFERNDRDETLTEFFEFCVKIVLNQMVMKDENLNVFLISNSSKVKLDFYAALKRSNTKISLASFSKESDLLYAQSIEINNSSSLILNETKVLESSLKTIHNSKAGFLICQTQIASSNLVYITGQTLGNETYYLYKAVKSDRGEDPSPCVALNSPQWLLELKKKLLTDGTVYVVGSSVAFHSVQRAVEQCSELMNANKIRFVFLECTNSVFNPEVYKDHLRKDLRVNVLKNGQWGTWLFYLIDLPPPTKCLSLQGFLYQFKDIQANDIHLHALGLNLTGLTEQDQKLGVIEFSGTRNGKSICGLGTILEDSRTLEVDEHFVWDKPSSMSHEEAASCLLSYAMACFFLQQPFIGPSEEKRILVHNAEMPLCQAVIYLALKKQYEIYMTYDDVKKKKFIRELFPQVPEDNILKMDEHFFINFTLKTNGKKMRTIINTSENKSALMLSASFLGFQSLMYQISSEPTKPGVTIGLRTFLQNTALRGFGPESLLNLPEDNKQLIWTSLDLMLKHNELKPFYNKTLSPSEYNIDAVFLMKNTCSTSSKFVVKMDDDLNAHKGMYACKDKKCCLLFGKENKIWFDLIQWFVRRGVRHFIIGVNNISKVLAKRLNILLDEYEFVKINLFSPEDMKTQKDAFHFISEVSGNASIEIIFIFGEEYCEELNNMSIHFPDVKKIHIGKGLKMDVNNNSSWQKKLAISIPHDDSDLNTILKNLDSLLNMSEPMIHMIDSNINSDFETIYVKHWEHLPDSIEAFVHLARSSRAVRWKEVRTSTLPYSHSKDVPPVLIIPPLKQGQFDQLIRGLFHPAFEAVIPPQFKSIEDLAEDLYKALEKFNCGIFTLICADWSYHIGLSLGRLLEKNGKQVSLILLNIDTTWANLEIVDSICSNITINSDSKKKGLFQRGLNILKHRLEHVLKNPVSSTPKYQGLCRVLENETNVNTTAHRKLKEYCQHPIKVHSLKKENYIEMVNSHEAIALINSTISVEHKDSCRPSSREYEIFDKQSSLKE